MTEVAPEQRGVFADRLNQLFETVHPRNRGPFTLGEVAEGCNKIAGRKILSDSYLSQLRRGERTDPSFNKVAALATFFGVKTEFFSDDAVFEATRKELDVLAALRDDEVRRIALRASELSPDVLQALHAMIDVVSKLDKSHDERPEQH